MARQRAARSRAAQQLEQRSARLADDQDVMRVLFLLFLDLGTRTVHERTEPQSVYRARELGWITQAATGELGLTDGGLWAFWDWKSEVMADIDDPRYIEIWEGLVSW